MFASTDTRCRRPGAASGRRAHSGRADGRGLVALLVAGLLLLSAMACGDATEETVTGGQEASQEVRSQPARTELPPPTPDFRQASDRAREGGDDGAAPTSRPEPPVPQDVSYSQAESLYHQGEYEKAVRYFRAYTEERPDNPWGHYMLGLSAWKWGQHDEAEDALLTALELDPDHVKSLVNLGRVLLEQDRAADAAVRLERARELAPGSGDVLRVLGNARSETGERQEAIRLYRQAVARDSTDAWSMNNLGYLLIQEGRFSEALPALARATRLRPDVGVFQNNLGVALERTGHYGLAAEAYGSAAEQGHGKASVSLVRVEDRSETPDTEPLELEELARQFARESRSWRVSEADTPPAPSDSGDQQPADDPDRQSDPAGSGEGQTSGGGRVSPGP